MPVVVVVHRLSRTLIEWFKLFKADPPSKIGRWRVLRGSEDRNRVHVVGEVAASEVKAVKDFIASPHMQEMCLSVSTRCPQRHKNSSGSKSYHSSSQELRRALSAITSTPATLESRADMPLWSHRDSCALVAARARSERRCTTTDRSTATACCLRGPGRDVPDPTGRHRWGVGCALSSGVGFSKHLQEWKPEGRGGITASLAVTANAASWKRPPRRLALSEQRAAATDKRAGPRRPARLRRPRRRRA